MKHNNLSDYKRDYSYFKGTSSLRDDITLRCFIDRPSDDIAQIV